MYGTEDACVLVGNWQCGCCGRLYCADVMYAAHQCRQGVIGPLNHHREMFKGWWCQLLQYAGVLMLCCSCCLCLSFLRAAAVAAAVAKGDRIAQLVLECIVTPDVEVVEDLDDTSRGAGGFGSTGVAAQ